MSQEKKAILEALIFASETPLTAERAADVLTDTEKKEIIALCEELGREYETRGGGILLVQVAGGFQFRTRQEMASWIRKLRAARPAMLSPAALETLAVIAYRQPIVKADIDRIRGVDVSGALKGLLEKKIVRIVGRKDVPGKPIIYGTTKRFLEIFNLKALSELPTLRDLKDLQIESGVTETLELPGFQEGSVRLEDGNATEPSAIPDPQAGQALRSECGSTGVPELKALQEEQDRHGHGSAAEPSRLPALGEGAEPQIEGGHSPADSSASPALSDSQASQSDGDQRQE